MKQLICGIIVAGLCWMLIGTMLIDKPSESELAGARARMECVTKHASAFSYSDAAVEYCKQIGF